MGKDREGGAGRRTVRRREGPSEASADRLPDGRYHRPLQGTSGRPFQLGPPGGEGQGAQARETRQRHVLHEKEGRAASPEAPLPRGSVPGHPGPVYGPSLRGTAALQPQGSFQVNGPSSFRRCLEREGNRTGSEGREGEDAEETFSGHNSRSPLSQAAAVGLPPVHP